MDAFKLHLGHLKKSKSSVVKIITELLFFNGVKRC